MKDYFKGIPKWQRQKLHSRLRGYFSNTWQKPIKRVFFGSPCRGRYITVGKLRQRVLRCWRQLVDHIASAVRRVRVMKAAAQLAFSFLFIPGLLPREQEQHCPHLGDQESSRVNYPILDKPWCAWPKNCFHVDSKSYWAGNQNSLPQLDLRKCKSIYQWVIGQGDPQRLSKHRRLLLFALGCSLQLDRRTLLHREKSLEPSLKLPPPPCQMFLVPASAMQAAAGENSSRSYPLTYLVLWNQPTSKIWLPIIMYYVRFKSPPWEGIQEWYCKPN